MPQTNPKLKAIDWAVLVPADPQDWEINPEPLLRVRTNIAAIAAKTGTEADPDEAAFDHDDGSSEQWTEPDPGEEPAANRNWTEAPVEVGVR